MAHSVSKIGIDKTIIGTMNETNAAFLYPSKEKTETENPKIMILYLP